VLLGIGVDGRVRCCGHHTARCAQELGQYRHGHADAVADALTARSGLPLLLFVFSMALLAGTGEPRMRCPTPVTSTRSGKRNGAAGRLLVGYFLCVAGRRALSVFPWMRTKRRL
jgi:hypothetical protein